MTNEVEQGLVKIIGFVSGDWSGYLKNQKKHKMPDNYLSNTKLPKPLIELTKKNGWTDEEGNIYFKEDWQPEPYFDEFKNITYILANDKTPIADIMTMSKFAYLKNHLIQ